MVRLTVAFNAASTRNVQDLLKALRFLMMATRLESGCQGCSAWAELDSDLMRTNPPWAPIFNLNRRQFVSRSYGCFLFHPVYGVDITVACKK